ncbi:hypothetical protein SARC_07114 [Sphaeroforma arctica JP610]|uniref:Gem-associated protein 2 n=1 Tax=Sphaeroforma arctica JP610 TaxID=667725 RepID=A0A0L0FVD4_9EUKA|nr:hypothetical protein SARC_07114 [Sphaeroforma arctica JP610]KNC80521.1 hypothetical protein SARC_07114 [Sphaeroforma arctica JP610]|eukprot:XP_014154423.1 hypothetical protein SARC_07114 [Sphaeroforma arctica JP610]
MKDANSPESEVDEQLMAPAFAVSEVDAFDPTQPPATGEDFLRQVRHEARQYASTMTSSTVNPRLYDIQQTVAIPQLSDTSNRGPPERLPSEDWERYVLDEFKLAGEIVRSWQSYTAKADLAEQKNLDGSLTKAKVILPPLSNRNQWKLIFLGKASLTIGESDITVGSEASTIESRPILRAVSTISHKSICSLLGLLASEWRLKPPTISQLEWAFALFTCLETTSPDLTSTLRGIMKQLLDYRQKDTVVINSYGELDSSLVAGMSLIITIIGRIYGQYDLI